MNSLQQLRFVATLPFAFEGSHVVANANQAVEHLSDQSLEASLFPLESIRKTYGNLGIRSAFKKGDEWVVGALNLK
jgi:cell division GTPase FtsZ